MLFTGADHRPTAMCIQGDECTLAWGCRVLRLLVLLSSEPIMFGASPVAPCAGWSRTRQTLWRP